MTTRAPIALLSSIALAWAAACDDATDAEGGAGPAYADVVVDAPGHTGEGFGDSLNAANGVYGCGSSCGGSDVFSLGYDAGVDDHVTLRWSDRTVINGPGADFAVFENGFVLGDGPERFMDHVVVRLSRDGQTWVTMPHDYLAADETEYSADPAMWQGFAGVEPVLLDEETNPVDPQDPDAAGGDHFDLDDLPDDEASAAIKAEGFTYLKLVTAPSVINPDTGEPFVRDDTANGADIDGVYAWRFAAE